VIKIFLEKIFKLVDIRSAATFLTVGAIAAVINFSTFSLLFQMAHLNYKVAVSIGYLCSVIFHFTANRRFTFKSQGSDFFRHLSKYIVMISINYLITLAVVHFVVENLSLSPYIGVIAGIGCTVGIGYLMAKFWVFQRVEKV